MDLLICLSRRVRDIILFQRCGHYFNPSRVKVERLDTAKAGNVTTIVEHGDGSSKFLVAVSVGAVTECNLVLARPQSIGDTTFTDKRVSMLLHSQEFELMVGKFGMVFGFDTITADLENGSLTFLTRRSYPEEGELHLRPVPS